jgi:2-succinyl-6-hydroxy-2,4-cyclohexadiene-1-carboxylate synthase
MRPTRVALLHGFAGTARAWDDTIAAWPAGATHEPVAIALPGHGGGSVQPGWAANLDAIAATVAAVRADVVVGYSFGARLALGLLAGGHVARAVLIGVNPGIADADRAARRAADAAWATLLRERGIAAFADAWQAQPLFATQAQAPSARLAARRAQRLALDAVQLAAALDEMGLAAMPDYRAHAARATLVAGADDAKFVAIARALALPCHPIASCGHDPTLERPGALAALLASLV